MSDKKKQYEDPYYALMDKNVDTAKETKFAGSAFSDVAKNEDRVATTAYTNSGNKEDFMNDRMENAGE